VLWIGRYAPFLSDDVRLLTAMADIAANALYRALVMSTLEQRVTERTRELATANERLQELDRLKSKFVSDVSHELRTPLTNLKLYLNLVEHGRADKQSQYLGIMREQVDRLTYLIEAILDLSHLESGRRRMAFAPVDLNAVVMQVVGEQRARAEVAGLALACETAPDLPLVRGDRQALSQVVSNLVANAISYTAAGAVNVRTLPALECGRVCVEVQDSGTGIEPADLPHVFERFYRGQRSAQSNIPGTGLGLAIVKELVELHGGRVEVESVQAKGSTFRVWLPLAEFDN
jgi:signal transduction histidine kinase